MLIKYNYVWLAVNYKVRWALLLSHDVICLCRHGSSTMQNVVTAFPKNVIATIKCTIDHRELKLVGTCGSIVTRTVNLDAMFDCCHLKLFIKIIQQNRILPSVPIVLLILGVPVFVLYLCT